MSEQATTAATAPLPESTKGKTRNWVVLLLAVTAGILGVTVVGFAWVAMFGLVQGEEFSPHRFERRVFYYYQIPIIGVQILPIARETTTGDVEQLLVTNKYVARGAVRDARWDLVRDSWHAPTSPDCDARILCAYFDAVGEQGLTWKAWTEQHPAQAKLLWPAIAEVAREGLYVLVPELIESARSFDQPGSLQTALSEALLRGYRRHGEIQQQRGRHERAIALFSRALDHDPLDVATLRGRAKSLLALGRKDKAAADLAEAQKLDAVKR
jgi:hypothetical protein